MKRKYSILYNAFRCINSRFSFAIPRSIARGRTGSWPASLLTASAKEKKDSLCVVNSRTGRGRIDAFVEQQIRVPPSLLPTILHPKLSRLK